MPAPLRGGRAALASTGAGLFIWSATTMAYCASRFATIRRPAVEVKIGSVGVGGAHPIRVQSMTTSDTQDVAATVRQCIALAEVGCEIVRVTAPNVVAARCLRDIRAQFSAAGFAHVPLVADIHFLPAAAMEAVEHVEKVRVNPGNYADKKKFAVVDYSDAEYERELQRLHESVTPLVKRCRELGRALRIGTNHGSLSDRIMNRYGDSPLGMVESALEFVRICESHDFHDIVLSMKASNPKVVIQAYRLLVERMDKAHRAYPLHLGVTEAGDGEDGRIKSAIGIGSLLLDGIGDTIRVSLTEDSVYEIPVAQALAAKAMRRWSLPATPAEPDRLDPFSFKRRETALLRLGPPGAAGAGQTTRVIAPLPESARTPAGLEALLTRAAKDLRDNPPEALLMPIGDASALAEAAALAPIAARHGSTLVLELAPAIAPVAAESLALPAQTILARTFAAGENAALRTWLELARRRGWSLAAEIRPADFAGFAGDLVALGEGNLLFALRAGAEAIAGAVHPVGGYRQLAECLRAIGSRAPLWIRACPSNGLGGEASFLGTLLDASILAGALLCDGLGDLLSVESGTDFERDVRLAYNVLQGAGTRISKTEFVACPSCGRTLFDLQTTTQKIRTATGHLKGVKIAVMGCIVNGPGEMADADFGYVGGAPGKINLYVGKTAVRFNIPETEAVDRLVDLIREHGKWFEPAAAT
ncbi:MAG TPA: (E)-4-hydroxy-3-methylbut-2-enyl-diphosphate synthase [Opitutaceae bacterium]|nr:(E)-4-hydroxy-3-methylbut-2-enyl-diphosphate synthase [Opitutaceae bacterium]